MNMQKIVDRRRGPGLSRRAAVSSLAALGLGAVTLPLRVGPAAAASDLTVMDWSGYEIPELHQAYTAKYGGSPDITIFADDDEAYQKIHAGFRTDLLHPSTRAIGRFRDGGLIKPIDPARLSHWGDMFPVTQTLLGTQTDGKVWIVNTDWGYNSMIYRTDMVDIDEESWLLLWDERYKGRIAMTTEPDSGMFAAALSLGIADPFHMTDDEIARVREHLMKQRELVRFYWTDPTELEQAMASGEVVAAYGWTASYSNLKAQGIPAKFANPKEGSLGWITGFVMLADGPGDEQHAYDYIDAWLAPETGKYLIDQYGYGHTNRNSYDLVSTARLEDIGMGSPEELLKNGVFMQELSPDLRTKYVNTYTEVMAGG